MNRKDALIHALKQNLIMLGMVAILLLIVIGVALTLGEKWVWVVFFLAILWFFWLDYKEARKE